MKELEGIPGVGMLLLFTHAQGLAQGEARAFVCVFFQKLTPLLCSSDAASMRGVTWGSTDSDSKRSRR